jgi:hypothetical protein
MQTVENDLQPQLEQAQRALATALNKACGVKLKEASTGEMIRVEETLAVATLAAKKVVSIRLRRRKQLATSQPATQGSAIARAPADVLPAISQRVFDEVQGRRWRVYAVHPSMSTVERDALPDAYRHGWLSFEAADEKRRIAPIPEGWEALSIDELRLLCQRAQRVPKRTSNPITPPDPTSQ